MEDMSTPGDRHPNADVRMRGFRSRIRVADALVWLDDQLPLLPTLPQEAVSLAAAAGRVLASDVVSRYDVPQFCRAMMDGYAVRAADVRGASTYNRLPLKIVGTSLPGAGCEQVVASGEAVRIMTGAPLPPGADAVLPAENVESTGAVVHALDQVAEAKHIGTIGEDIRSGEIVLQRGRRLRPQDVGVLSSIGQAEVTVVAAPSVALVVTGNELLPPGTPPRDHLIADSNGPMLAALVGRDGGTPHAHATADRPDAILAALHAEADVVIVSGGSSVGEEDFVPTLLAEHGELAVHGIAMRPSSPTGMGRLGDRLVFLLPGNPVSCLCAYDFFAGRAIRRLGGRSAAWPYRTIEAPLRRKITSVVGRLDYARVQVGNEGVAPLAIGGASVLSSATRADGFVIINDDSEGYREGAVVTVYLYDNETPADCPRDSANTIPKGSDQ